MKKAAQLLFFLNLICCFYFFALAFYNRPALDDFCVMAVYNEYGIFNSVAKWYVHWQARFSAHLLNNLILKSYELTGTLFHFTVLMYAGFLAAFYRIALIVLKEWKNEKWFLFNLSAFVFHLFLLFNFEFSTFYWVNVSTMYFGGLLAGLFVVTEIFNERKTVLSWLILLVTSVYAGSSAENFALIFFLLLNVFSFYFFLKKDERFLKSLFAVFVFSVAMVIMLIAPGTAARQSMFPENDFFSIIIVSLKSAYYLVKAILNEKWVFLMFLVIPAFIVAKFYPKQLIFESKKLLKTAIGFFFFIWFCLLPTAYAMGEPGPLRAQTYVAFYIVLFALFLFYHAGQLPRVRKILNKDFFVGCSLIFLFVMTFKCWREIYSARKYTISEDKKTELILNEKHANRKELLVLKSAQADDYLVLKSNTLAADTSFFANRCVCNYYKLDFPISEK